NFCACSKIRTLKPRARSAAAAARPPMPAPMTPIRGSDCFMLTPDARARSRWVLGEGLERVKGIEPSSSAWKAVALPLSYTRAPARHLDDLGCLGQGFPAGAKVGGRGRTRTYEGIASGFTVRPLCRSGHSPKPLRTALTAQRKRNRRCRGCGFMVSRPVEVNGGLFARRRIA